MRGESTSGTSVSSTADPSGRVRRRVVIVIPALATATSGNWQTAARWARMLGSDFHVRIVPTWQGEDGDALIALHARRSAASIAAFAQAHPARPRIVVLTGTDLYRDIRVDAEARRSLELATRIVTLQDQGPRELPAPLRTRCCVIYQSARRLAPARKPHRVLRVLQVGHLRDEKDPATFLRAAERLAARPDIRFEHVGAGLDGALAAAAARTQSLCPHYRWLGALPHAATRQRIRRAHLLVNSSRMEGGAHVVLDAARCGTAVLASRVAGNVGMLGRAHEGYFEVGDDAALAALIARARDDDAFLQRLQAETEARAPLFEPAEERRRLLHLLHTALETPP
jgi:putative glycosyltransferase (TIGR04348 family)